MWCGVVTELWFSGASYGYDRVLKKGACRGSRKRGAGVAGFGGGNIMSPQENSMESSDAEAMSSPAEETAMEECGVSEAAP